MRGLAVAIGATLAITAIVWSSALGAGLVFDDHLFFGVLRCWQVDSFGELLGMRDRGACGYRPLRYISYGIDYRIWGLEPFGYHLTNVLLHLGATLGLAALLRRLGFTLPVIVLGTLWWALHPVQTDSVTYISGRRDLLTGLFFLAGALAWPRPEVRGMAAVPPLLLTLICFVLALGAKEMAVTLPVVLVALRLVETRRDAADTDRSAEASVGARLRTWLPIGLGVFALAAIAAWFTWRWGVRAPVTFMHGLHGGTLANHVTTVLAAWGVYLELIVLPLGLVGNWDAFPVAVSPLDPRALPGLLLLGVSIVGALPRRRGDPRVAFGFRWFLVTMLPVSHVIPHHEIVAEHYLYLPLVGLAIAACAGLARLESHRLRVPARSAVVLVLIVWSALVTVRNQDFRSEERWHSRVLERFPGSPRANAFVAEQLAKEGNVAGALRLVLDTRAAWERGDRRWYELTRMVIRWRTELGELDAADADLAALEADHGPNHPDTVALRAPLRARQGNDAAAAADFARLVRAQPDRGTHHLNLGIARMRLGDTAGASEALGDAAILLGDDARAWRMAADAASAAGAMETAVARLARAVELSPGDPAPALALAAMQERMGDRRGAAATLRALLPIAPDPTPLQRRIDALEHGAGSGHHLDHGHDHGRPNDPAHPAPNEKVARPDPSADVSGPPTPLAVPADRDGGE